MTKTETVTIDKLIPGGQGIGTLESGKKALVWGALPGETVEFEITKNKSSFCEGNTVLFFNKSEHRVNPRDLCYLATSPWQIMDYDYELEQKSALVAECFRQNQITPKVNPTITDGKSYYYRNKMEYSLYWDNATNKIELAFRARGTHRKGPITESSIERSEILTKAKSIIKQLNAEHKSARDYQSLLARCDQKGNVSSALYENYKPRPRIALLSDTLCGYEYFYSPNSFFQVNLPVYNLALVEIKEYIETDKVLDLYAGVGTIGLSIARDKNLTLVEVDKSAFAELVTNCSSADSGQPALSEKNIWRGEHNRLTAVCASSEEVLDYITPDTTVILDPPRAGCDAKLIDKLAQVKPPTIIYLSCNPITQARDIKLLLDSYEIQTCQPFNFFPRTPHIENLVVLRHKI